MKHRQHPGRSGTATPDEQSGEEPQVAASEGTWPQLSQERPWPLWRPQVEPSGLCLADEESLARTRTWRRRNGRRYTLRPSRCLSK